MVSKGQFVGLDWNRITRLHSQVMIGTQEVKNSLTASRCHLKAYQRCGQPTSKVSILKMKQQQHDINLRRTRKKKSESQMGFEPTTLDHGGSWVQIPSGTRIFSCNCRQKNTCPLNGNCLQSSVIYQATVKRSDNNTSETYMNLTTGSVERSKNA